MIVGFAVLNVIKISSQDQGISPYM